MSDLINKPDHYNQIGFECIDMMSCCFGNKELLLGFLLGNAFKYIWRHKSKNGAEDLDKAEWYLKYAEKYASNPSTDGQYIHRFLSEALKKARGEV